MLQEASHPNWSPKGDLVALQCYAGGTFHIWTMRPDGTGLRQITSGHGDDREPRISPDGGTIAFASDRAFAGSYDIWTVPVEGGEPKQITHAEADEYEPAWSPDGKSLVFVAGTGVIGRSIEEIDLPSGQQHTVASIDPAKGRFDAPSISPDGKLLAFVRFEVSGPPPAAGPSLLSAAHLVVISLVG